MFTQKEHTEVITQNIDKALGIFNKAKLDLLAAVDKAKDFRTKNEIQMEKIRVEHETLDLTNKGLNAQIDKIHEHISKIDAVVG